MRRARLGALRLLDPLDVLALVRERERVECGFRRLIVGERLREIRRHVDRSRLRVDGHRDTDAVARVHSRRRLHLPVDDDVADAVVHAGRRAPGVVANRHEDRRAPAAECALEVERDLEHRRGLPHTLERHGEALRGHRPNHMFPAMGALRVERDGEVLRVTLARPERRNAFDAALIAELTEAFADVGDARAVVLSGEGPSFCAGADVEWQRVSIELDFDENVEDAMRLYRMLETIDSCPAPVVCAVHGYALGGGSGLVACADIGIAQPDAVFGFTEVRLGIIPAVISPFVLARIGAAARRYFVTGERFDAETALRIGLVSEVVEDAASGGRVGRGIDPRGRPRGRARGEAARARAADRYRDCADRCRAAHERRGPGRAACLSRLDEGEPGASLLAPRRERLTPPVWLGPRRRSH